MRYQYHDIVDHDFEKLVVAICAELLGPGIQPFSSGPDGGRDARFSGTAEKFPSIASRLSGKFVIQAKHTEHPYAKFSDPDFSGVHDGSVVSSEIPKIRRLVSAGEADFYLLFSNRRLAGVADEEIRARVIRETGVREVEFFGIERIDLLLKAYPSILRVADINIFSGPLLVNSDDLAEVILILDKEKEAFTIAMEPIDQVTRTSFQRKNIVNGLTDIFATYIVKNYMREFDTIKRFLSYPGNKEVLDRYLDAAAEFHEQILVHRAGYVAYDDVLVKLQHLLFQRDSDLARNKRLVKLVIYYMYWNCDLGLRE